MVDEYELDGSRVSPEIIFLPEHIDAGFRHRHVGSNPSSWEAQKPEVGHCFPMCRRVRDACQTVVTTGGIRVLCVHDITENLITLNTKK